MLCAVLICGIASGAACNLRQNVELAGINQNAQMRANTTEECCAAMPNNSRCQDKQFPCVYFVFKDPALSHFDNCVFFGAEQVGYLIPSNGTISGWVEGASVPADMPPADKVFSTTYPVSSEELGLQFDGIGAISGGGATTKLLLDYEPEVISDILDYMFLPNFGLALQILKVEIGGDTDATEGAESSHMHSGIEDANYNTGYEWWLMKEAKKRNPNIKLYGLSWGFPGWLNPNSTAHAAADPNLIFSYEQQPVVANYTVEWVLGAKREHNLDIDYLGLWNERSPPDSYAQVLGDAVENAGLHDTTTVLGKWPIAHYGASLIKEDPLNCTQYPWDSNKTNATVWMDEDGSISDGRNARCLARIVNRNYVHQCKTATIQVSGLQV
jgi:hypothetical protein